VPAGAGATRASRREVPRGAGQRWRRRGRDLCHGGAGPSGRRTALALARFVPWGSWVFRGAGAIRGHSAVRVAPAPIVCPSLIAPAPAAGAPASTPGPPRAHPAPAERTAPSAPCAGRTHRPERTLRRPNAPPRAHPAPAERTAPSAPCAGRTHRPERTLHRPCARPGERAVATRRRGAYRWRQSRGCSLRAKIRRSPSRVSQGSWWSISSETGPMRPASPPVATTVAGPTSSLSRRHSPST
jgi:hypothetical protein